MASHLDACRAVSSSDRVRRKRIKAFIVGYTACDRRCPYHERRDRRAKEDAVHSGGENCRKLSRIERFKDRCGRCPVCGQRLERGVDPELTSAWTFVHGIRRAYGPGATPPEYAQCARTTRRTLQRVGATLRGAMGVREARNVCLRWRFFTERRVWTILSPIGVLFRGGA